MFTLTTKLRNLTVALTATLALGLSLTATGPAAAQPVKDSTPSKGCPVEDEHGNTTYVPEGTRVGLFRCGSDGEWHFGWLVNARVAEPEVPTKGEARAPRGSIDRAP